MRKHALTGLAAACIWATTAPAESIITYESYDDQTPDDPAIDLCIGCSATIEIWITPTDGQEGELNSCQFVFEGEVDDGVVTNGGIVLSDFRWAEQFHNPATWLISEKLPNPSLYGGFWGTNIPLNGLLLGTIDVTGTIGGIWNQHTAPQFIDNDYQPISLAPGSDNFDVRVSPDDCSAPGPDEDCNGNGIHDICDIIDGTSEDCNINGVPDECDLTDGTSDDCNENTVPDECETDDDCNGNQRPDDCDLTDGTSDDCNENAIPDECETDDDCNGNQRPDECDLTDGTSDDCNENAVPDECETDVDCNENQRPDECDIADQTSGDCNDNGLPDECDIASGDSADDNMDGFPDECGPLYPYLVYWDCVTGSQGGVEPGCAPFDMDRDDDVDLIDYAWFQIAQAGCGVVVTQHPADQCVCAGDDVVMELNAAGAFLIFQWRRDGEAIPGATESELVLQNVQPADAGLYDCEISSECGGSAWSSPAELTVSDGPIVIVQPPQDATLCAGATHFMYVAASGFAEYQWFLDGAPIPGATAKHYIIVDASSEHAGLYHVVATNGCNTAVSDTAVIEVIDCEPHHPR